MRLQEGLLGAPLPANRRLYLSSGWYRGYSLRNKPQKVRAPSAGPQLGPVQAYLH